MSMATAAGWYDDGAGRRRWWDGSGWTDRFQDAESPEGVVVTPPTSAGLSGLVDRIQAEAVAGGQPRSAPAGMSYVVLQIILKERFWGTGSGNLTELEKAINAQAALGYRLHTITTAASGSKGIGGGDRIQATMVFERIERA